MRLVCISDTHYKVAMPIPDGDVLIHAGDMTGRGTMRELAPVGEWLRSLPHSRKIVVPGNHDTLFESNPTLARSILGEDRGGLEILIDQMAVWEGVIFWGSPWSNEFMGWAFGARPGGHSAAVYGRIPMGVDVLITHGPPMYIRDRVGSGPHFGNPDLLARVREVRPKVHVFGHIHDGYGQEISGGTHFINAAMCDEGYKQVNPPVVVDL